MTVMSPVQTEVVAAVRRAGGAASTTRVRELVNEDRPTPLVAERIYTALAGLYRRGLVRRAKTPGRREVYWKLWAHIAREAC